MNYPSAIRRTRILFICHDGKIYGSQKSLQLLIENLPSEKYEIFVSFGKTGPLADYLQTLPHVHVFFHQRIQGAKHSPRNLFQRIGDCLTLFCNAGRALPLVRLIQAYQIDIVHTNSLVSFEGAIAAKLAGVPHIWHIRELFAEKTPRFHLILGRRMTKALVHHFSQKTLCISHYVSQQFQPYLSQFPMHYQVLYNAIPPTSENFLSKTNGNHASENPLQLLYLGRISNGKRFQDILEAFCLLKQRWGETLPFQLKAYGDFISPQFKTEVEQQIKTHQLAPHISFPGYTEDIDPCFSDVDLLLMPSSQEAFGRTLLEAMSRGVPVLAARSGGPLEVIEDGESGFFHTPNQPSDLAQQLEWIYQNRTQLPVLGQRSITRIQEKFDLSQQIHALDNLYQELVRRTPRAYGIPRPCRHGS